MPNNFLQAEVAGAKLAQERHEHVANRCGQAVPRSRGVITGAPWVSGFLINGFTTNWVRTGASLAGNAIWLRPIKRGQLCPSHREAENRISNKLLTI